MTIPVAESITVSVHPSEDDMDEYLLNRLVETDLAPLEEHVLICDKCREGLEATFKYIQAFKHVLVVDGRFTTH